jgi:hypothetical protein
MPFVVTTHTCNGQDSGNGVVGEHFNTVLMVPTTGTAL